MNSCGHDNAVDAAAVVEQLVITSDMIRQRTKRLYRDAELLRRLTAQHDALVQQLAEVARPDTP